MTLIAGKPKKINPKNLIIKMTKSKNQPKREGKIKKLVIERSTEPGTFPAGTSFVSDEKNSGDMLSADFPIVNKINEIIDRLNHD